MEDFSWECPICARLATITSPNVKYFQNYFQYSDKKHKNNDMVFQVCTIICPNPDCREYTITASLHTVVGWSNVGAQRIPSLSKPIEKWQLVPYSNAKTFPEYIPLQIRSDYKEACLILNLSPKASATLFRRCLQGMIRHCFEIKNKRSLKDEIEALRGRVELDPKTLKAIDSVRAFGNIGAHMDQDVDLIFDVEPKESELLKELIETLIHDWYIVKHEREESTTLLIEKASKKKYEKQNKPSS